MKNEDVMPNSPRQVRSGLPLIICAPRNGEQINMMNPIESFSIDSVYSPGVVFSVNQKKYDNSYLITSIDFARRLFERQGMITSLELKLKDGVDIRKAKEELKKIRKRFYDWMKDPSAFSE